LYFFFEGLAFAGESDIDRIKNYDFDSTHNGGKNASVAKSIFSFLGYLFLFIIIATLAFFTTKYIAKAQQNYRANSKYMELIDSLPLGNDRGLYIVKAPQGLLMLGVTPQGISLLEKLDTDKAELIYEAESSYSYSDRNFAGYLNQFLNNTRRSSNQNKNGDL